MFNRINVLFSKTITVIKYFLIHFPNTIMSKFIVLMIKNVKKKKILEIVQIEQIFSEIRSRVEVELYILEYFTLLKDAYL